MNPDYEVIGGDGDGINPSGRADDPHARPHRARKAGAMTPRRCSYAPSSMCVEPAGHRGRSFPDDVRKRLGLLTGAQR
jgi:hypothetical protein